jgi:hypothetical protein
MFHLINTQKKEIFYNQKYITDTPPKRRVFSFTSMDTIQIPLLPFVNQIFNLKFRNAVLGGGCEGFVWIRDGRKAKLGVPLS